MKKICFINGSPRGRKSGSKYLADRVIELLDKDKTEASVSYISELLKVDNFRNLFDSMLAVDSVVFIFPLYQDCIPASMLDFLTKLEAYIQENKGMIKIRELPRVYAIVNSGFIESKNNQYALQIMQHFCNRTGLNWRFGLGIGAGEFMKKQDNPMYLWMKQPVLKALSILKSEIENPTQQPLKNIFVNPRMPSLIYNSVANGEWRDHIRENQIS